MEHPAGTLPARAEDLLRMLAAALGAVRLYPPASPLRNEAITRFIVTARDLTLAHGPLQYRVDRNRFIVGDTPVGATLPSVVGLAETLHRLQVGQMIVAPDLTESELVRFLDVISGDSVTVRGSGGIRKALIDSGVQNIAVVEVTLRASTEEGILGLDLTAAPLTDIAPEITAAAASWADAAAAGDTPTDSVADAIERLEPAARDLALSRCAEALRFLDEATRASLLETALHASPTGETMSGMLDVIAHVPPAALARLLRVVSQMHGDTPENLMGGLDLPPEIANEVAALLKPSPQSDEERGVPAEADVETMASEVAGADEHDVFELDRLVAGTTPRDAAARGLDTAIEIARLRRSEEALRAVSEAIPAASAAGALREIAVAVGLLDEYAQDPGLAAAARAAREPLADPSLARESVRQLSLDRSSDAARTVLVATGATGAEALIDAYVQGDAASRERIVTIVEPLAELVAPTAGRILRNGDPATAIAALAMLRAVGSRRLVPTVALGLEHLDSRVREATVKALSSIQGTESVKMLERCLGHWDPETRRAAARHIGEARVDEAVPALVKVLSSSEMNERNYELKKEVLKSLEVLRSDRAVPALQRLASRRVVFGKKHRELRYLAQRALDAIEGRARSDRRGSTE
jgi:hypothetical protein